MNYRPTDQLRRLHDAAACPDDCPHCARVEAFEAELPRKGRDYLIASDYPEDR